MTTDEFWLDETDLEIPCPKCATEMVQHEDTEFLEETPDHAILECGKCGEISIWEYSLDPRRIRQVRGRSEARELPPQALPSGLRYIESPSEMLFILAWRDVTHAIGVLLLAGMFLVVAYQGRDTMRDIPLPVALAGGTLLLLLIYGVIVQLRNHTTIRVTRASLSVEHGPLPWSQPRRRELLPGEIVELECVHRPRNSHGLAARMKSGTAITLKWLIPEDAGDFIARRANWFMKQRVSRQAVP